jgi:superfamily II DNA or RNA helicase
MKNKNGGVKIKIKKSHSFKKDDIVYIPLAEDLDVKAIITKIDDNNAHIKYIEKEIIEKFGNNELIYPITELRKVEEIKPTQSNKINPNFWIDIQNKYFIKWVNDTFYPYLINKEFEYKKGKDFEFSPLQKFVRDYLQLNSPYRGLLLYHGLGLGKTCSSIAIAENLKNNKNIVVMVPASLKSNYKTALLGDCGNASYKANPNKIKTKYTFVSYNASNTVEQLDKIGSLDNHVIIIDEIHNLISMMVSESSKKGPEIYKRLMEAKNVKIIGLSGTPIINYPFEVSILANILRGYIELAYFNVIKVSATFGKNWKISFVEEKLKEQFTSIQFVEGTGKNIYIKININTNNPEYFDEVNKIKDFMLNNGVETKFIGIEKYTLFPENEDEFRTYFVDDKDEAGENLRNEEMFKRRLIGLISYNRGASEKLYPKKNQTTIIEVPMSDYQFLEYEKIRAVEKEKDKGSASKKLLKSVSKSKSKDAANMKISAMFRVFSRQFSNFVFPEDIERPFKVSFLQSLKKNNKNKNTSNDDIKILVEQEAMTNNSKKLSVEQKKLVEDALQKLRESASKYLILGKQSLNKYSPKMSAMLEIINKSKGIDLVYSAFRSLEGVEIFSLVLKANGYESFNINPNLIPKLRYAVYSGTEDDEMREKIIKTVTSYDNRNGEIIKVLLITSSGAEGLDLKNIRNVLVMEPYWHETRIDQVIGRAIRINSHVDLPPEDRTVDVYRFHSVFTPEQRKEAQEDLTTDEYIYDLAQKKIRITNQIKQVMKEIAVDCKLNQKFNNKDIKCFSFGDDVSGQTYKTRLEEDIVYSKENVYEKKKKATEVMFMDKDKQIYRINLKDKKIFNFNNKEMKNEIKPIPKNLIKVAVDTQTNDVYDFNSVKTGNPIQLGVIDDNGKVV